MLQLETKNRGIVLTESVKGSDFHGKGEFGLQRFLYQILQIKVHVAGTSLICEVVLSFENIWDWFVQILVAK
jgi:hypothetical protein